MVFSLRSQNVINTNDSNFDFGIASKISMEFGYKYPPAYKLSLTGGIAHNFQKTGLSTAFHSGVLLINNGSIGANHSKKWYQIQSHFYTGAMLSAQLDKRDFNYTERNVPLYHFSEFTANPLQNPYKTSLSYGVIVVFVQDNNSQRIGFFNLNVAGRAQVSYYNDGGPVLKWVGDKRDRFYTGGVIFSYHANIQNFINLVELSYHKYTGYQEYAFDIADKLQIDFLNYNDSNQFSYNQQRWRLNFSNLNNGFGGSISVYNCNRIDFQDFLHFNTNVPYHPDYYRGYRIMIGGRYEYNNFIPSK